MLWWFAETSLIAGLLAVLAAGFSRLRPISPTTRHLLWLAVLIKFLTPPLVSSPWAVAWPAETMPAAEPTAVKPVRPPASVPAVEAVVAPRVVLTSWPSATEPDKPVLAATSFPKPARTLPTVDREAVRRWLLGGWLLGSVLVGLVQVVRIHRFHRRLRQAVPAPSWLADEADAIAERLGVRAPELLAVAELGSPMIWCLGKPRLLVPSRLLKSLAADQWRGVLAHELAHLRRGDHWVRRLELASELVWWWNPLYWAARRRIDAEAELACDAWVVSTMPDDRLTYAQVLLKICSELSHLKSPAPALSVAGSGLFFERRLNMILRDQTSCRTSPTALMGVCLLSLAALPSWTLATATTTSAAPVVASSLAPDGDDDDKKEEKKKDDESSLDLDFDFEGLEEAIESTFGPEFEKSMEEWAESFEKQFGEEFEKKMEAFGEQMEKQFGEGSEFAKKMEAFGKEMEKKFGEGSEFAKVMEKKFGEDSEFAKEIEKKLGEGSEFAKKMEEKFGEDSEFAKKMKEKGKDIEKKLGPGSEFEGKMKKLAEKMKEAQERAADPDKAKAKLDEKSAKADKQKAKLDEARATERAAREVERKARDAAREAEHRAREAARAARQADRKPGDEDRKAAEADRKPGESDRKAPAGDRKARLKQLEAMLQELAKEIKALESEDSNEE